MHINNTKYSNAYVINFSMKNIRSEVFAAKLDEHEVYISTKTSCCPENAPSKLVYALTKDKNLALTSLRLSLSHLTTKEDVETFKKVFDQCYKEVYANG